MQITEPTIIKVTPGVTYGISVIGQDAVIKSPLSGQRLAFYFKRRTEGFVSQANGVIRDAVDGEEGLNDFSRAAIADDDTDSWEADSGSPVTASSNPDDWFFFGEYIEVSAASYPLTFNLVRRHA